MVIDMKFEDVADVNKPLDLRDISTLRVIATLYECEQYVKGSKEMAADCAKDLIPIKAKKAAEVLMGGISNDKAVNKLAKRIKESLK